VVIDPLLLRENPDIVKASQRSRGAGEGFVDDALAADSKRRASVTEFENLRAQQNAFSKQIGKASADERPALLKQVADLATQVKEAEAAANRAEEAWNEAITKIENIVLDGVPAGGEENSVTLREVGQKREFDFEPLDHLELGERLGIIDMARGAKVSGARFYFLVGMGARLEIALMNYALQRAMEWGFTPVITPTLVRPEIMAGTGFLGEHSDEIYHLGNDDLYLVGTSEVALAGYHSDEILDLEAGPLKYAGWSTCYRREAGSGGKDTRGIIRVHQFNKLEGFIWSKPEDAESLHAGLLGYQESLLQDMGLAYQVLDIAAGDLGSSAARKYDVEAWVPTQGKYRELTSTSNCTTYQARRLGARYRTESGKTSAVATLNGTLATTRWLVALLEHGQQRDGSVVIPKVLQELVGAEVIEAR